ncbi:MAG TPA: hypothetical protein PLW02_00775 [Verrucomicrobiota bacterium]|nr:hypothetical protein [Verrucomicrobiota bacterium]
MHNQIKPLIWLVSIVIILSGGFANSAASTNKTNTTVKLKGRPFHGIIKTVDYKDGYIVLQGKSAQTFYINSETKIKIDGVQAGLKDITTGVYVGGYARWSSSNNLFATTLNIDTSKSKTNKK